MNLKQNHEILWISGHLHYKTREKPYHPPSSLLSPLCSPQRPREVHFKVWWMVQKVWSRLQCEFSCLNSIFERQTHPICHGFFFLKGNTSHYLEYKTAKSNVLQTENHTFRRQTRPLKRTSRPLSRDVELSSIYFMQKSREASFDQSQPTFPFSSCLF